MAKKFLVNIDLGGNQILNAILSSTRVQNTAAASPPAAVGAGQLWYDSTNNQLNVYNGSSFVPLTTGGTAVTSLNSFTGAVNIYGTANQVAVTNSTGSITLSLPTTVSLTTACATNFYGTFNGTATNANQLGGTAASAYALLSGANFTAASVGGNAVATQSYVTGSAWSNSSASVGYSASTNYLKYTSGSGTTDNIAVGKISSLQNSLDNAADKNIAIGFDIQTGSVTGFGNVAIGSLIQSSTISTGTYNVAIGYQAGLNLESGNQNVFIGISSGTSANPGNYNVGVGPYAFAYSTATAEANTAIGGNAMYGSPSNDPYTGSYNAAIGYATELSSGSISGAVAIGTDSTGAGAIAPSNNSIQLGTNLHTVYAESVNFTSGSIGSSPIATQSYVTASAWSNSSASVGYATNAGNSTTTSQTNFTSLTISASSVATEDYVTSQGYVTSSGSVAYATNAGNSSTTSQTDFSALTISGSNVATQAYVTGLGYQTSSGSVAYATSAGNSASLGGQPASYYAPINSPSFTGTVNLGSNTATGSVSYATNAGNSTTTSQTTFSNLISSGSIGINGTTQSTNTSTGALVVAGGAGVAKNLFVGGNLEVSGSVFISGSAFTVSSSNIVLNDPLLYLAHNNSANISDLGFVASFNDGTYQHSGLVRDATDGRWKLFSGVIPEPDTTVNFASATYDTLQAGGLIINSSSTTTTASITSAGAATLASLTVTGALTASGGTTTLGTTNVGAFTATSGSIGSNAIATQSYVTTSGWSNSSASVGTATNSTQLGGVAAASYALLSSANFTAASVGGNAIATQSYVSTSGWNNTSASVGYAANSGSLGGVAAGSYALLAAPSFTGTASATNLAVSGTLTNGGIAVARKVTGSITGDGTTASWSFTHNLNTRDVAVQVYQTSTGPDAQYNEVEVDIERTTASAVKVTFATAPTGGGTPTTYNVVIVG